MTEANQPHSARRAMAAIGADLWAMPRSNIEQFVAIASRQQLPDLDAAAGRRQQLARDPADQAPAGVQILDVHGAIFPRANLITEYSGGTSLQLLAGELQRALDNPNVKAIVLHVDSPGGAVSGVADFGAAITRADRVKPVVAFVAHQSLSAAFWIASAAREVVASSTSIIGSIGVIATVDTTTDPNSVRIISSQTPGKIPDAKQDAGRAALQKTVDAMADVFLLDVARNRGASVQTLLKNTAGGGQLVGANSVAAGLADSVSTFADLLERFGAGGARAGGRFAFGSQSGASAAASVNAPAAGVAAAPPVSTATGIWDKAQARVGESRATVIHHRREGR